MGPFMAFKNSVEKLRYYLLLRQWKLLKGVKVWKDMIRFVF